MDPEANQKEQLEVAEDIMKVWDEHHESNSEFTESQKEQLVHLGERLAALVISLAEWNRLGN